jgi:hypothetical protein
METKINLTQWDDERHLSKMREVVNDCLTEFFERNKISGQSVENDVDAFADNRIQTPDNLRPCS